MFKYFVDTSGWGAWADSNDQYHSHAVEVFDRIWNDRATLITSSFVLLELTALFNHFRFTKNRQMEFFANLFLDASIEVLQIDHELEQRVWQLWRERHDKLWTVTDCSSFIIMQELGITEAVTADHHFAQAGFVCLIQ
ncbi:MAG: PIN domain-containing protein [Gemmatales bacterium]